MKTFFVLSVTKLATCARCVASIPRVFCVSLWNFAHLFWTLSHVTGGHINIPQWTKFAGQTLTTFPVCWQNLLPRAFRWIPAGSGNPAHLSLLLCPVLPPSPLSWSNVPAVRLANLTCASVTPAAWRGRCCCCWTWCRRRRRWPRLGAPH